MKPNKQKRLGKAGSRLGMMDELLGLSAARPAMSVSESHPPESSFRASSHRSCPAQFWSSAFREEEEAI
jgi:hypothetical protein